MNATLPMNAFRAAAIGLAAVAASPALAHHPLGGETPGNFLHGFLSGIGHPMIGIDHFAFIVVVGIAAAFMGHRLLTPLAFVGATAAGCLLTYAGVTLPLAEVVITASVVLLGALVVSGRKLPLAPMMALFAVAGLFHGGAYGEAIVGAEATPLLAYLLGFGLIQYGIAVAAGFAATTLARTDGAKALEPRLAGAVCAGVGFAFLVENVEGMIFTV